MLRVARLALLALAIGLALPAHAEDGIAPSLPRVEVHGVAARPNTVDDIERAQRRLDERPGATALVDAERYRQGRAGTLSDALSHAPGVFVQPRFGADEARLSIRGSGLQRTFHGRGLELLQDGSPLNLADGGYDFQAVEPLSARYIEIHRGANALEYGAATLGGAINFVSPTGYDAPTIALRAETGSDGYRRGQVAAADVSGRADGYLSLSGAHQDGNRDHAQQRRHRQGQAQALDHERDRQTLAGHGQIAQVDQDLDHGEAGIANVARWRDAQDAAP